MAAPDYVGRHLAKKAATKFIRKEFTRQLLRPQIKKAEADARGERKLKAANFLLEKLS